MKNWIFPLLTNGLTLRSRQSALFNIGFVLLFLGGMLLTKHSALMSDFELDTDEGFNVIKAWLYAQGFPLYGQTWNDQPPLYTILLAGWMRLWGWSLPVARTLTLGFSALLVWCFYQVARQTIAAWGLRSPSIWSALIGVLLLATSWGFPILSVSAMIGLPALALALLSIYWLLLYQANRALPWLIASGVVMGLSLQTKLFTVFLVPIVLVYWGWLGLHQFGKKSWQMALWPWSLWLLAVCLTYLVIGLTSGQLVHLSVTLISHLQQPPPSDELLSANFNSFAYLRSMLAQDRRYLVPVALGTAVLIVKRRQWSGLLPIFWLLASTGVMLKHQPIWYHHYLLLSIPFYWLLSVAIALLFDFLYQKLEPLTRHSLCRKRIMILGACLLLVLGIGKTLPALPIGQPYGDPAALEQVIRYKPVTQWLFTDRPIYAFKAGLRVPPETAVISAKRLNSGNLTMADLLALWQRYQPEQILLARWTDQIQQDPDLARYLSANYVKTYTNATAKVQHYVRQEHVR